MISWVQHHFPASDLKEWLHQSNGEAAVFQQNGRKGLKIVEGNSTRAGCFPAALLSVLWVLWSDVESALLCNFCRSHVKSTWLNSHVSSSPRYTYGQPVQGNAQINVCQQRFYSPLCKQNWKKTCEGVTGLVWYITSSFFPVSFTTQHVAQYSVASLIYKGTPERQSQWCGFSHYLTDNVKDLTERLFFPSERISRKEGSLWNRNFVIISETLGLCSYQISSADVRWKSLRTPNI